MRHFAQRCQRFLARSVGGQSYRKIEPSPCAVGVGTGYESRNYLSTKALHRARVILMLSSLAVFTACSNESATPTAASFDLKDRPNPKGLSITKRLSRESGVCLATSLMNDGTYKTRTIRLRLPKSMRTGKPEPLGYYIHAKLMHLDSAPSRIAFCTLPRTVEAGKYFSEGFSGARPLGADASLKKNGHPSNGRPSEDYRAYLDQDILAEDQNSVASVLVTETVRPELRKGSVSAFMNACDPNAIIQEPDCVPDGSGVGGGGGGGNPQYCDPNVILPEEDCFVENEVVSDTPPTVFPDVVSYPSAPAFPCYGGLLTNLVPGNFFLGLSRFISGNSRIVCSSQQASLIITYKIRRQRKIFGWSTWPVVNRGYQIKLLADSTAMQTNTYTPLTQGWYRDVATFTVFWLSGSPPTTADSDQNGIKPAFKF